MKYSTAEDTIKSAINLFPFSGPKTQLWVRHVFSVALLMLLAGCTPLPPVPGDFSCASFTESHWEEFRFDVDTPSDVVSTVVTLWGIERDQIELSLRDNGEVAGVKWRADAIVGEGGRYYVPFHEVQQLKKIYVKWGDPKPALTQIIDCLGIPNHFIAFYTQGPEAELRWLVLLYTEDGLVVRHVDTIWSFESPGIHPNIRMDEFVVVSPGTAEQVATNLYSYGNEVRYHARAVCLLKPWPGSIKAMEMASEEERIQCGVFP